MHSIFQDFRYAVRMLGKQPGFTAVALITLALGIGANTAIFSVVYTVLLKPLPFGQPEELVQLWEARPDRGWTHASGTHANFWDLKDMNRAFEDVGTMKWTSVNLSGLGYPERLRAGRVSAGFFRILRVQPVLGRTFVAGEDEPASCSIDLEGNFNDRRPQDMSSSDETSGDVAVQLLGIVKIYRFQQPQSPVCILAGEERGDPAVILALFLQAFDLPARVFLVDVTRVA